MANGRCKRHGGKSTGAKTPNFAPAVASITKYGIYSQHFGDDDKAFLDNVRLGQVDDELRYMRVRLNRTLAARAKWEQSVVDGKADDQQVLVERNEDEVIDKEGCKHDVEKRAFKLPNFDDIIDRTLARIESLEKTRKELLKDGDGDDPPDGEGGTTRDRVTFTGGLDGGNDDELPSPFAPKAK